MPFEGRIIKLGNFTADTEIINAFSDGDQLNLHLTLPGEEKACLTYDLETEFRNNMIDTKLGSGEGESNNSGFKIPVADNVDNIQFSGDFGSGPYRFSVRWDR